MEESTLLIIFEHISPQKSHLDWELYCLLFHVNIRFRRWVAGRSHSPMERHWQSCKTCRGHKVDHAVVADLYLNNYCTCKTLDAIFRILPTLLLLPEFQQKCHSTLERYGQERAMFARIAIWDIFPILFRSQVTLATISLFKMCLLGFRGCIFKKKSCKPYSQMRLGWAELRQQARRSAWADLFHQRQPRQIMAALEVGQWKRISRDSSPVRRKIK